MKKKTVIPVIKSSPAEKDPRIANVLARLNDWAADDQVAEAGRFVETSLLERVNFEAMSVDELRRVVLAIAKEADDDLLDAWDAEANSERMIFLDCTACRAVTDALRGCGVKNGAIAESIAQKAMRAALAEDAAWLAEKAKETP